MNKRPFILYTETIGLSGQLLNILYAMEYCERKNQELYICCDTNMYGDLRNYFEFDPSIKFISGIPPGYMFDQTHVDTAHPNWDYVNAPFYKQSINNYEKMCNQNIPFEKLREYAKTLKPLYNTVNPPSEPFDAVLIRRGDKVTSGDNGFIDNPVQEYFKHTTLKNVFVMSDDYSVIKECKYKNIISITPEYRRGFVSIPFYKTPGSDDPFISKSIEFRIKDTRIFINEIYIAAHSEKFVSNFKTSGAQFVKLIHKDPENCVTIV